MKVKVQTWGNSLGLRIPKAYATELGVHPGSEMEVNLEAGTLLAKTRRRHRLERPAGRDHSREPTRGM